MQITSKKLLIFAKKPHTAQGTWDKKTEKCTVAPTGPGEVVSVPDWVKDDPLFKLAVKGGDIMVVEVKQVYVAPEVSDDHVKFLASRGYTVEGVEGAKKFVSNLNENAAVGFFADFEEWKKTGLTPAPEPEKPVSKMNLEELKAYAAKIGAKHADNATKADIVEAITEKQSENANGLGA